MGNTPGSASARAGSRRPTRDEVATIRALQTKLATPYAAARHERLLRQLWQLAVSSVDPFEPVSERWGGEKTSALVQPRISHGVLVDVFVVVVVVGKKATPFPVRLAYYGHEPRKIDRSHAREPWHRDATFTAFPCTAFSCTRVRLFSLLALPLTRLRL